MIASYEMNHSVSQLQEILMIFAENLRKYPEIRACATIFGQNSSIFPHFEPKIGKNHYDTCF